MDHVLPTALHQAGWASIGKLSWKPSPGCSSRQSSPTSQSTSTARLSLHINLLSAHQFVVCIQSKFFDNAFRNFAEGETKTMNLDAATEAAYWRVFEYMYTGDYPDQLSGIETEDESEYLQDPRVYALADMYFLEDLKLLSEAKFRQNLKKIEIGDGFAECVREVYATTSESDKTMRSAVVEAAVSRRSAMTGSGKELIYGGGDFVVDYIEALRQYTY